MPDPTPKEQKHAGELCFAGARTGDILATDEGIAAIAAAFAKRRERIAVGIRSLVDEAAAKIAVCCDHSMRAIADRVESGDV